MVEEFKNTCGEESSRGHEIWSADGGDELDRATRHRTTDERKLQFGRDLVRQRAEETLGLPVLILAVRDAVFTPPKPLVAERHDPRNVEPSTHVSELCRRLGIGITEELVTRSLRELADGTIGASTIQLYDNAAKIGVTAEFQQGFLKAIRSICHLQVAEIPLTGKDDQTGFVLRSDRTSLVQTLIVRLLPNNGGIAETSLQTSLDQLTIDPLTCRTLPQDHRSTAQRAKDAGVILPPIVSTDGRVARLLSSPDFQKQNLAYASLSEVARSWRLSSHELNHFYQNAFFQTNNAQIRQQAIQGLREEVRSGKSESALRVLQELTVNKALIEFKEASAKGLNDAKFNALVKLAALESESRSAAEAMHNAGSLAEDARAQMRLMARQTYDVADHGYKMFLSRDLERLSPQERQSRRLNAIAQMDAAADQRLTLLGRDDFSPTKLAFVQMSGVLAIAETDRPDFAARYLDLLFTRARTVGDSGAVVYARTIDRQLRDHGVTDLAKFGDALRAGGREAEKNLQLLKKCLPDLTVELNALLLDQITHGLRIEQSGKSLAAAISALEVEEKRGNSGASELLRSTIALEAKLQIVEAVGAVNADDPTSVEKANLAVSAKFATLAKLSRHGNSAATDAILSFVDPSSDSRKAVTGVLETKILSKLSNTQLFELKQKAAATIGEIMLTRQGRLDSAQSEIVCLALAEAYKNGDKNLETTFEAIVKSALKGQSREAFVSGMISAMSTEQPGAGKLSEFFPGIFRNGLSDLQKLDVARIARCGNEGALRSLAAIAGTSSNEDLTRYAAGLLTEVAGSPSQRDKVIDILIDQYNDDGDCGMLLSVLGKVATFDVLPNPTVLAILRGGFEKSSKNTDSRFFASAKSGFLAMVEHFNHDEVKVLSKCFGPHLVEELQNLDARLPNAKKVAFLEHQRLVLEEGGYQSRLIALKAFTVFARAATPDQVRTVITSCSKQGQPVFDNADSEEKFLQQAAKALVASMGSPSMAVKDLAFRACKDTANLPGVLGNAELREKIIDYVNGKPVSLELNQDAMHLIYDAGIARPLAGALKDLRIKGTSDELLALAEKISTNYQTPEVDGASVARRVLANAITINALSDDLREQLTGTKATIDIALLVGRLANGSTDANTPPKNPLFMDLEKWLWKERGLASALECELQAVVGNQECSRQISLKKLSRYTVDHSVGTLSRLSDLLLETNRIPDFERKQAELVQTVERKHKDLQSSIQARSAVGAEKAFLELAHQCRCHFELSLTNSKAADEMLISMVGKHGPAILLKFAKDSYDQIPAAMERLKLHQLGNESELPGYKKDLSFDGALKTLENLKIGVKGNVAADYMAIRTTALHAVDAHPFLSKLQASSSKISESLPILQEMFQSGREGSRYTEFVKTARAHAGLIQHAMNQVTRADVENAREAIKKLEESVASVKDKYAAELLRERIKAYKSVLELFDGEFGGRLRNVLNEVLNKDGFDETTFSNWLKKEALPIAAAIIAASAVMAFTAGTGAVGVLAGLVLAPAAGMTASEVTKEGLCLIGVRKEGALFGEYFRGSEIFDPQTNEFRKLRFNDVTSQYQKQYLNDLALCVITMGGGKALAGATSKLGQATIGKYLPERGVAIADLAKGLTRAEVAAAKIGKTEFLKEFYKQLQLQSSFAAQASAGEGVLHQLCSGEIDKYGHVLVSILLVAKHTGVSFRPKGKFIEFELPPDALSKAPELLSKQLLQFHADGFSVRPLKGGAFEVVSPNGTTVEFRPAVGKLAESLAYYRAPEALSKPIIDRPNPGDFVRPVAGTSTGLTTDRAKVAEPNVSSKPRETTAPRVVSNSPTGSRGIDVYTPEVAPPTASTLKQVLTALPELTEPSLLELESRVRSLEEKWCDDHRLLSARLQAVDSALHDATLKLQSIRAITTVMVRRAEVEAASRQPAHRARTEEQQRLDIEDAVRRKVSVLENNPEHSLGRSKSEHARRVQEASALGKSAAEIVHQRTLDLQRELSAMSEAYGWPPVEVEVSAALVGSAGAYRFGHGKLVVSRDYLLSASGGGELRTTLLHEMVHAVQDRLIVEYALKVAGGDLAKAGEVYRSLTKHEPTNQFVKTAESTWRSRNWNVELELRARDLAAQVDTGLNVGAESARLGRQAVFIAGRLYHLQRNSGNAVDRFFEHCDAPATGRSFMQGLFPGEVPLEVQSALTQWRAARNGESSFSAEAARQTLCTALEASLAKINARHRELIDTYAKKPLEAEVFAVTSSRSNHDAAVGPQPGFAVGSSGWQRAQDLLAKAAQSVDDSLNPAANKHHAAVRSEYERRLSKGTLTPDWLQRILALKPDSRSAVEDLLRKQLPERFISDLMKLKDAQIEAVFNIDSPNLVPFLRAAQGGLMSPAQMHRVALMKQAEQDVCRRFLSTVTNKYGQAFSPEAMTKFIRCTVAERANVLAELSKLDSAASAPAKPGKVPSSQLESQIVSLLLDAALRAPSEGSGSTSQTPTELLGWMVQLARGMESGECTRLADLVSKGCLDVPRLETLCYGGLRAVTISKVLEDPAVREAVLEMKLDPRDTGAADVVVTRVAALRKWEQSGLIDGSSVEMLAKSHPMASIFESLLANRPDLIIGKDNIAKLLLLTRDNKISLERLEAYLDAVHRKVIDPVSMEKILAQPEPIRRSMEVAMMTLRARAPEGTDSRDVTNEPRVARFQDLLKREDFAGIARAAGDLTAAAKSVFLDMVPEGGKYQLVKPAGKQGSKWTAEQEFAAQMFELINDGKPVDALSAIGKLCREPERGPLKVSTVTLEPTFEWQPKILSLAELNNPGSLHELLVFMRGQGNANGDQAHKLNPNAVQKRIKVADCVVRLSNGQSFRLRDATTIYDSAGSPGRRTTVAEQAMIKGVQESPSGMAILKKTAMVALEEWQHTVQGRGDGCFAESAARFQRSNHFDNMKAELGRQASSEDVSKAMREIDVCASLKDLSGVSTSDVMRLFGDQHIRLRRHYYEYLIEKELAAAQAQLREQLSKIR